jgi:hypothetical protein
MRLKHWLRLQWDRVAAVLLVAGGLVAIAVGWFGATGTVYTAEQIPYVLSGGLAGVTLAGLGAALWVSADLKDEWLALRRIEELLGGPTTAAPSEAPATELRPERRVALGLAAHANASGTEGR